MPEVIRVAVGTEPMQWVPYRVLVSSILRRVSSGVRVEFYPSWTQSAGWAPLMRGLLSKRRLGGTLFSAWRWLVPQALHGDGLAVYLDADQCCLCDLSEILHVAAGPAIHCVRDACGWFGGTTPEPGVAQTSVMVVDLAKLRPVLDYDRLAALVANDKLNGWCRKQYGKSAKSSYAAMMQACWLPDSEIGRLAPQWNHFNVVDQSTRIVHWSHVRSQPYRDPSHATAGTFREELASAVAACHLSVQDVVDAVKQGFLHEDYQ